MTARGWEIIAALAAARFGWFVLQAVVLDEKACWACKGTGKNPWSTSERRGKCWICRGNPWRPTRGARLVRRIWRGLWGSSRWGK